MIPYKGRVTLDRTIRYLREEVNYLIDPSDINVINLTFRLDEEEISRILFQFYKKNMPLSALKDINHFCDVLNVSIKSNQNKAELMELMNLFIKNKDMFLSKENIDKLFSCFSDKKIGIEYLRYIYTNKKIEKVEIIDSFVNYLIQARPYYVDDRALLASSINLVDSIDESNLLFGDSKDINDIINKKLIDDKKANGIYDVDQYTLEEMDRKLTEFDIVRSQLETLRQLTEQQIEEVRRETKNSNDDIANIRINTLKQLKTEANKILSEFNTSYLELLSKQKESIINEKDVLMADIETEIQKYKLELQALATSVGQRIAIELGRIKTASEHSIEKIDSYVENNERSRKLFEIAKEDEAFVSRLSKLDLIPAAQMVAQTGAQTVVGQPVISVPSIILPGQDREVDKTINYYFNEDIPFSDRFNELMAKKQEDIEKTGAVYHENFDDLLTMVLDNNTPYVYGPSGCGKTYIIEKQLSKILGLNVLTNGYVMYESDVLGFNNANGIYVPSNLYRCYKYGDILFLDEFDNSYPKTTIALNSFLDKGKECYTFPDGQTVERHPNFRIITAGNTKGNGGSEAYNTREKFEGTVERRLTPIELDYDSRIEKKILENYPDWYNFAINFRNALKEISIGGSKGPNYKGTITTGDIETIKKYKDQNSFSDDKIIIYEIIGNKDRDYLNQIISKMEKLEESGKFTSGSSKLLSKFKTLSKGRSY